MRATPTTIIVAIVAIIGVALGSVYVYQSNQPCTGSQMVTRDWPVFDTATQELMATRGQTFTLSGLQDPALIVGSTAQLRDDVTTMGAPIVLCEVPRLVLCPFGADGCTNYRTQFEPVVAKYYVAAFYTQDMQGWTPDAQLGIIEQFAANFATRTEMSLQYAVVAPTALSEQAGMALHPAGYFASLKPTEDEINWTSAALSTVPSVLNYDRYANTVNVVDIANGTDVILLDPQLSLDDKRRWIGQLQEAGYTLYIYPAAELYVTDK